MRHNWQVRIRRFRSLVPIILGILVMTSFWHVSHADFHAHGDSDTKEAGPHPLPATEGDGLSLHPVHVVGYLSASPSLALHIRWFVAAGIESFPVHSPPPFRLFRPPRS